MSFRTYLWIEDRRGKAGCIFWEAFMRELCPEVVVESMQNSSELVKAVRALRDGENRYIIVFDNSFDNPQICQERKMLKKYVEMKDNVRMLDIICFEYILLEFEHLIDWIYASDDEFLVKRAGAVRARKMLVDTLRSGEPDYKRVQEIIAYDDKLDEHNIEQLSARLLYQLTRNTGFEVSKGAIGDCWIRSCCSWEKREENDICGLDYNRMSAAEKMRSIYAGTSLEKEFRKAGLEVAI